MATTPPPSSQHEDPSYIDASLFQAPTFSAPIYANNLILRTNDPSDTSLDLTTPLSRVLFDQQEIDTRIDTLTTRSALPLLNYTSTRSTSADKILNEVEQQVKVLEDGYKRLERDVAERWTSAEQVRLCAERLVATMRIGRGVGRVLGLARLLEGQMAEVAVSGGGVSAADGSTGSGMGGQRGLGAQRHRAMVPAARTVLEVRGILASTYHGGEGEGLERVIVVNSVKSEVVGTAERNLLGAAQQIVREFSMSSLLASNPALTGDGKAQGAATFAQTEDTKARTVSALTVLYLLSPVKTGQSLAIWEPSLLISALQSYLQMALTSSLASLARALATLPTLERTLLEISARCQNIVALEALLGNSSAPDHPLLSVKTARKSDLATDEEDEADEEDQPNFLDPLLQSLDTSSLPSFFWRTLASNLSARVQEILNRGGVSARTLRSNRDRVAQSVRECVARGSQIPAAGLSGKAGAGQEGKTVGIWEREAAVMVGSILGVMGRS